MGKNDFNTTIRIWDSTRQKLDKLKKSDMESYNSVILRLLEELKQLRKKK